jgi:hypothetical protein
MEQLNLFEPAGADLRDAGMQQAITHADDVNDAWSDKAYYYLTMFVRYHQEPFMAEDFRAYCEKYKLPQPPHLRAYGGIIARAAKSGLIQRVGFRNLSNAKAHCTPAAVWEANKE